MAVRRALRQSLTARLRAAIIVGTLVLGALPAAVSVSTGQAGAVRNAPAANPTSPAISYEADCTTTLEPGQVAPFLTELLGNTTVETALPSGTNFGFSGSASTAIVGTFIANLEIFGVATSTTTLQWTETLGSTDGNAVGTYAYSSPVISLPTSGGTVTGVSWASGTTTLTGSAGAFLGVVQGDGLASSTPGIPSSATVSSVAPGGSSVTISVPTTAAGSNAKVGYGATMVFTDPALHTGNAFATHGTNGGTAGVGVIGVTQFAIGAALPITFGGKGASCTETGWDATGNAGPAQPPAKGPVLPPGTTTALVIAGTKPVFPAAAFVNLVEPPPTAGDVSVSLSAGQSSAFALAAATGNPAYPVSSCALVPGSLALVSGTGPVSRLSIQISGPGPCTAMLADSGSGAATITFQYTATDSFPLVSNAGTVTVTIGSAGVDQAFSQQVNPGRLVLSCTQPTRPITGMCPLVVLPVIRLSGYLQTTSAPANTIYVSDNRGNPVVGWSLTTYMVATTGTNPSCAGVVGFCDQSIGHLARTPNGRIPATNLSIRSPRCGVYTGNLNPVPTAGTGGSYSTRPGALTLCAASAGESGGTFTMGTKFTLTVPPSVYAGQYLGTVEYLVS